MPRVAVLLVSLTLQAAGSQGPEQGFRTLRGDRARVLYVEGDSARAARILALAETQSPLAGLPPGLPTGVTIQLVRDERTFDRVTGGRIPDWGAGVAIPSEMRMVLPLFATGRGTGIDVRAVLRHEWAHLALHQYLDGLRVPRWFDEGYAQWVSGGWDAMEGWRLRVAFATGRAPPLDSLELSWPRDRASAQLAYGLSATVLEYLVEESGVRGLEVLLSRWPEQGFDRALRSTYGIIVGQLERDWQKYVEKRYGWLLVLSHSLLFWALLSSLLLVMVLIRRRRNREAMARLVAREGPDRPAFWLGEPDFPTARQGVPSSRRDAPSPRRNAPRPRQDAPTPRTDATPGSEAGTFGPWAGRSRRPRLIWIEPLSPPHGADSPEDGPEELPEGSNEAAAGYEGFDPEDPDE